MGHKMCVGKRTICIMNGHRKCVNIKNLRPKETAFCIIKRIAATDLSMQLRNYGAKWFRGNMSTSNFRKLGTNHSACFVFLTNVSEDLILQLDLI